MTEMETESPRGLRKFVSEYNSSFKSISDLQAQTNNVLEKHKVSLAKRKLESKRTQKTVDDDGWTTVTKSDRHGFRARKALPGTIAKKNRDQKPAVKKRAPIKFV